MGAPIYFTEPPCCHSGDCGYIDCDGVPLHDQSLFFNCGYVVPPLNAQYEEVQPDLHSLERYDFSKCQIFPGTLNRPLRVLYLKRYAYYEKPLVLSISLRKERKIMIDKQQDFLTLTGAARRARSEGYDITYHSLRNLVAAGYISHVPNGSRIYIFYPNLVNFIQNGLTAEQSLEYQLSRARN